MTAIGDCKSNCFKSLSLKALTDRLGELTVEELKDEDPHQTWEVTFLNSHLRLKIFLRKIPDRR